MSINIRTETPPFVKFKTNLDRIADFIHSLEHQIASVEALLKEAKKDSSKAVRERAVKAAETLGGGTRLGFEWLPVMMVTFTEAYLQEVLAYLATFEPDLMKESKQSATYSDVVEAESIINLAWELRTRWAHGWLNDGGPKRWISRLTQMGARGYPPDLSDKLEVLWGVRHVVVHSAGFATTDFVRRHPEFGASVDQRLSIKGHQLDDWLSAVRAFAENSDAFMVARTAPKLERNPA